jgi:hypothetical protein
VRSEYSPPNGSLVAGANTQYHESKEGSDVMLPQKNSQKRLAAATAHLNELLDEALKETFPASDPIAINVELESPEHRIATTQGFPAPLRSGRKAPSTR